MNNSNNNFTNNNDISIENITNNNFFINQELKEEKEIIDNIIIVLKKLIKLKKFDPLLLKKKINTDFIEKEILDYETVKELYGIQLFYTTNETLFEQAFNEIIFSPILQSLILISGIMVNNNLGEPINYYSKEIFKDERIYFNYKKPRDGLMKKAIEEIYLNDLEAIVDILEIFQSNKNSLTRSQVDKAMYNYIVMAKFYGGNIFLSDLKEKGWEFNEKNEYPTLEKIQTLRKLQLIGQYSKLFHPFVLLNCGSEVLFPLLQYKNIRNIISILSAKDLTMLMSQSHQFYNNLNNDIKETIEILKIVYESKINIEDTTWEKISKITFYIDKDQQKVFNGLKEFENLFPNTTKITNNTNSNKEPSTTIKLPKLNQIPQDDNNPERIQYNEYKKQIKQCSSENHRDIKDISNKKKELKEKIIYGYLLNNLLINKEDLINLKFQSDQEILKTYTNKFSKKYKKFIEENKTKFSTLNNIISSEEANKDYDWDNEPTTLELLFHSNHKINIKTLQDKYKYRYDKLINISQIIELLKQFTNIKATFQLLVFRKTLSNYINESERQIFNQWPNRFIENYQSKYQIQRFQLPLFQSQQDLSDHLNYYIENSKHSVKCEINNLETNFIEEIKAKPEIIEKLKQLHFSIENNWLGLFEIRKNINLCQKKVTLINESQWLEDGIEEIKSIVNQEDLNCVEFLVYLCYEAIIDELDFKEFKPFSKSLQTIKNYFSHSSLNYNSLFPLDNLKPLGANQSNRISKSIAILLQLNYLIEPSIKILKTNLNL
ncbi:expressed protein [Dictyostelium purpureum]|uniref:Expressed protein n=1 Tax=Dictyostelium purpureum TaxID=5786 RepID=F0ZRC5_DICPU|nr:uncharacterized protein DICPUDRAFT_98542 [Dictyostelium purpureum]EGC33491.1 expressed protein [Dictyostelium purpureum]|eukprot:XP_003289965.1 expressed protein [Dictyostelium purpureum]